MTLRRWLLDVSPAGSTLNTTSIISSDGVNASIAGTGPGGTIQSSNTYVHHGDTSARFVGGGTSAGVVRVPFAATNAAAAFSVYHYGLVLAPLDIMNIRHSSGQLFRVGISGSGSIQIKDSTGAVLGSTPTDAWAIDRWNRIEAYWNNSGGAAAGAIEVAVYDGDSLTPTGTLSLTGVNLGTAATATLEFGAPNAPSYTGTVYFDSIQMSDGATDFIGPYTVVNQLPEVTAGSSQTLAASATATLAFSVSDVDGTIASRATTFDFPESGAPSVTGGSTNTPSFTTGSAPQLYIVRHTAVDNSGGEGSATTEVRVPSAGAGTSVPAAMDATAVTGEWIIEGDATTEGEALSDESDTTYVESDEITASSQEITVRLLPRTALSSGSVTVRLATDTGTATATVRLRRGTTVLQTWTQEVDDVPTDYAFALSGTAISGANLDPGDIRVSVAVSS